MKAAVCSRYGPLDVLQIRDVEKPVPEDNEVLIEVRAVVVGGPNGRWIGPLARSIKALVLSRFVSQNLVMVLARRSKEDLTCRSMGSGRPVPHGKPLKMKNARYFSTS